MRNGNLAATDYSRLVLYTEFRRKKPAFHLVLYERRERIRHQLMLKFECHGFVFEITSKRHKTVYGRHFLSFARDPRNRIAHDDGTRIKEKMSRVFYVLSYPTKNRRILPRGNPLESQKERLLERTEQQECLRTGSWVIF